MPKAKPRRAKDIKAIGEFVIYFSRLEFVIRALFERLSGLPAEHADIVVANLDFAALCRTIGALAATISEDDHKALKRFQNLIKECLRINTERVRVVHGTWNVRSGPVHISRNTFKSAEYFSTYEEMVKLIQDTDNAFEEFSTIRIDKDKKWGELVKHLHEERMLESISKE